MVGGRLVSVAECVQRFSSKDQDCSRGSLVDGRHARDEGQARRLPH
jgi:hypothetical protein